LSVCDSTGVQLHPDDWGLTGCVVVHYGAATGRTTVEAACDRLGLTPDEYRRAVASLVAAGALVRRPDGEYDAAGAVEVHA
jgi:hypothetical protein